MTLLAIGVRLPCVDLCPSCRMADCRLKEAVMAWYQLNELQSNLQQDIAQEQHQLDCLDVATDVVSLSVSDVDDTIADLQVTFLLLQCLLVFSIIL